MEQKNPQGPEGSSSPGPGKMRLRLGPFTDSAVKRRPISLPQKPTSVPVASANGTPPLKIPEKRGPAVSQAMSRLPAHPGDFLLPRPRPEERRGGGGARWELWEDHHVQRGSSAADRR